METIIESCKELDFSWLPEQVGDFSLTIDRKVIEATNVYMLFYYENSLGWRWEALYDKEVEDYTVHVVMALFEFVDISFIQVDVQAYWSNLQKRCVTELTNSLIEPEKNFSHAYKKKGLLDWDFPQALPKEIGDYVLDIDPHHGIRMINGSYIIGEYRKMHERTGLIVFYNVLRDEFFGELRYRNYPEIDHHLDSSTIEGLEDLLKQHVPSILKELDERN